MFGRRRYEDLSRRTGGQGRRDAGLRVSDAEREHVVDRLRIHAGQGRLEVAELEQRIETAYTAKTRADLWPLLGDLPEAAASGQRGGARRVVALGSMATLLFPLLLAVVLLAFAPPALAWMGWPILGWWCFACLPAAGLGFAWCDHAKRKRARGSVRFEPGRASS